ncbi:MAG: hypothetical protein WC229_02500 [Candidatus Paceibacterota bacterium]|jgi:hypothetical protein
MFGLKKSTAFEILKNQADLEIIIGQEGGSGGFFFVITTGSQDNLRTLFTSEFPFRNERKVLEGVRELFETAHHFGEHSSSGEGFVNHIMGLIEKPVLDESTYISLGLIEMILDDLRNHRVAKTKKWFPDKEIQ